MHLRGTLCIKLLRESRHLASCAQDQGYFRIEMLNTFTRWIFFRDENGHWQWQRQLWDDRVRSHMGFESPDDCLYNAIREGYRPAEHPAVCSRGFKEGITGPILPGPDMCRVEEVSLERA
jgi:hypothetical protein